MTYHMQTKGDQVDKSFKIESQKLFPEKLFDIAKDDYLFRWTDDGTWISVVDENTFEKEVMRHYPRFLQIPSFVNLRRLFREYSFEWRVNEETSQYEFHHPCFQKDKPDLLAKLKTRRKSFGKTSGKKRQNETVVPSPRTKYSLKRQRSATQNQVEVGAENNSLAHSNDNSNPCSSGNSPDTVAQPVNPITSPTGLSEVAKERTPTMAKRDYSELKYTYWRNEFGQHSFHSGLPPEVWAQAPMPMCPGAVRVEPESEAFGRADPNYQRLEQINQTPDIQQSVSNTSQNSQSLQPDFRQDRAPIPWGWGPIPYFVPYHNEMYAPVPQWGQGAGDTGAPIPDHKAAQNGYPGMVPYWGYPNYQMPWGYPTQPPQDPSNHDLKPNVNQSGLSPAAENTKICGNDGLRP